jgi:phage shock protein PspC (stress-responsive transcriptional regulator)
MDQTKSCPACFESIDARAARCPKCAQRQPDAPGLFRDVPGRLVGGVCAALALHFNWDVTVMRVVMVASLVMTGGAGLWVYGLLWLMTPYERGGKSPAQRFADWVGRLFSPPAPVASGPGSIHDDEVR